MLPDGGSRPLTPEEEAALAASAAYGVPAPTGNPAPPPTQTYEYPSAGPQANATPLPTPYQIPSSTPAPAPAPQGGMLVGEAAASPRGGPMVGSDAANTFTANPLSTPRSGAPSYTGPLTNHSSLGANGPTPSPGAGYSPPTNSPSATNYPVNDYRSISNLNSGALASPYGGQSAPGMQGGISNQQGLLATYFDDAANHARGMKLAPPKQRKITIEEHKDSARRGALRGIGYTPQGMVPAPGTGGSIGIDPINNPQQQPSFATPLPPPPPQTAAPGSSYMDQVMWGAYGGDPNAAPPVGLGLTPSTPPVGDGLLGRGYGSGMDSQLALGGQQTAPIAAPWRQEPNLIDAGLGWLRDNMPQPAQSIQSEMDRHTANTRALETPSQAARTPVEEAILAGGRGAVETADRFRFPSVGVDPMFAGAGDWLGAHVPRPAASLRTRGEMEKALQSPALAAQEPTTAPTTPAPGKKLTAGVNQVPFVDSVHVDFPGWPWERPAGDSAAPPRTSADQLRQFGRDDAGVSPYGIPQEPAGKNSSYTPPPGKDAPPLPKGYTADGLPEPGNSNFVMSSFLDAGYVDGGGRWTPAGLAAGQKPDPDLGVVLLDANGAWTPEAAAAGVVPLEAVGLIGSGWAQSNSGGAPAAGAPLDPNATAPIDVAEILAVEGGNAPSGGYTPRSSGGGGSYGRRSYGSGGGGYSGGGGGRGGFDFGGSFGSDDFDDSGWEDFLRDFDNDGDMDEKDEAKARKKAAMRKKTRRGTRGGKSRVPQPGLGGVPSFPDSEIRTNTLAAIDKSKKKGK